MRATLEKDQWIAVWQVLDGKPSPLRASVEEAGKAAQGRVFATEGTYYDFAEVVCLLGDCETARELSYQLATELGSEVAAINKSEDANG